MIYEKIQICEKARLTTYLTKPNDGKSRPAIIICPGGGYVDTTPNEAECVALEFVRSGYQCFVLDYSTYNRNYGHSHYPQPLLELGKSVELIRKRAQEWWIEEEQVFLLGFSGGGNLIANYGNRWKWLAAELELEEGMLKVAGLVLCYPVLDWKKEIEDLNDYAKEIEMGIINGDTNKLMAAKELADKANYALFNMTTPTEEQMKKVSPCHSVNQDTPPSFIWHTVTDDMVSVEQIYRYVSILNQQGIGHELHVFTDGHHGLSLANACSATKEKNINQSVNQWVALARQWLSRFM
ncbi:MAG: alpha/beta hydrolase [Kineothrix sp.]|nr:alpha/beta hydrolase [Kineothrix sp.]